MTPFDPQRRAFLRAVLRGAALGGLGLLGYRLRPRPGRPCPGPCHQCARVDACGLPAAQAQRANPGPRPHG
jgi:hypothetical protein